MSNMPRVVIFCNSSIARDVAMQTISVLKTVFASVRFSLCDVVATSFKRQSEESEETAVFVSPHKKCKRTKYPKGTKSSILSKEACQYTPAR